jgi:hypothetical protein
LWCLDDGVDGSYDTAGDADVGLALMADLVFLQFPAGGKKS